MGRAVLAAKLFARSRVTMLFLLTGLAVSMLLFTTAAQTTVMFTKQGKALLKDYPWDAYFHLALNTSQLPDLPDVLAEAGRRTGVARLAFQAVFVLQGSGERGPLTIYVVDNATYRALGFAEPCILLGSSTMIPERLVERCSVFEGEVWQEDLGQRINRVLGDPGPRGLEPPLLPFGKAIMVYPASEAGEARRALKTLIDEGYKYAGIGFIEASMGRSLPSQKQVIGEGAATVYVVFDREAYFDPADLKGSAERLHRLASDFARLLGEDGYRVLSFRDLGDTISGMEMLQTITRVTVVFSELPSIVIVGVMAMGLPSVIVVRLRRLVALVKARGIDEGSVAKGFQYTSAVWIAVGAAAGYVLGLGAASLLTGYPLSRAPRLVDNLSTLVFIVLAIVVPFLAARRSISLVSGVPVSVLERGVVGEEEIIGRPSAGKLAWLSLGLGLYYVVTRILGFTPMDYWEAASGKPLLMLILLLLTSIDGFVDYLGPVFLAYGAAKVTASSRRMLGVVVGLASRLAGEYREAAARLASSKPFRIALVVMIAGFAIGSSVSGLVSGSAARAALERSMAVGIGAEAAGYKYMENLTEALAEARSLISEAHERGVSLEAAIYINTSLCDCSISLGEDSRSRWLSGILVFINPEDMEKAMLMPDRLGGSAKARSISRILREGHYVYVAPRTMGGYEEKLGGRQALIAEGPKGWKLNKSIQVDLSLEAFPGGYLVSRVIAGSTGSPAGMPALGVLQVVAIYSVPQGRMLLAPPSLISDLSKNTRCMLVVFATNSGKDVLEKHGFRVVDGWEEARRYTGSLDYLWYSFETVTMSGLVLLAVASIVAASVAYASIDENAGSYAALRARGVPLRAIAKMINAEILAPSLLSAVIGFALGVAGGLGAVKKLLDPPMMTSMVSAYLGRVPIVVDPLSAVLSLLAVIPVVLAAVATGYYALRGPVGEALRRTTR